MRKGTRVKVYATLNGVPAETKGVIVGKRKDGMLHVELHLMTKRQIIAHPKQCRKLLSVRK